MARASARRRARGRWRAGRSASRCSAPAASPRASAGRGAARGELRASTRRASRDRGYARLLSAPRAQRRNRRKAARPGAARARCAAAATNAEASPEHRPPGAARRARRSGAPLVPQLDFPLHPRVNHENDRPCPIQPAAETAAALREEIGQGDGRPARRRRAGAGRLVACGHVLIEGVPGLGKTLLVRALARRCRLRYARIQFTPDLMPSDITGHTRLDPQRRSELRDRPRPGVHQPAAGRRDQPRAGEDAEPRCSR